MTEQLDKVKAELQQEMKNVCSLKARVSELEVGLADMVIHCLLNGCGTNSSAERIL